MAAKPMTEGEKRVFTEAPSGEPVVLGDLSDEERVVLADVIRRLCVGPESKDVDPRGVRIEGARIVGTLDLSFCTIPHPLRLVDAEFEAVPDFNSCRVRALTLESCRLPGFMGYLLDVEQTLSFAKSQVDGTVAVRSAKVGGDLRFRRGRCADTTAKALAFVADDAEIGGSVLLDEGFSATGQMRLMGARIGGDLGLRSSRLTNRGGVALTIDRAEIGGSVFLDRGCEVIGEIVLPGAKIQRQLSCQGARLVNEGRDALRADDAEIGGGVFFDQGFRCKGGLRLLGVTIGANLECRDAQLDNGYGHALFAANADIRQHVFLRGATVTGTVYLLGAKIGGDFECSGATISRPGGNALFAEGAEVGGSVQLDRAFTSVGSVCLVGTRIHGALECVDATLDGEDGTAFDARDAAVDRSFVLRDSRLIGGMNLYRTSATTLDDDLGQRDDLLGSWRDIEPLVLEGFAYARFGHDAVSESAARQRWLQQSTGFQPGAWQQLIDVYRAQGRVEDATRTAIAMNNARMRRAGLPWYRRAGRFVLWAVIGHGYRSWLAGVWAAGIIAAFALVVWHWSGMLVARPGTTGSPQPVAYAADSFLPVVNLGQADDWTPTGWLRWVDWSVILLGWSLTTLFVAGFTRIVRSG